MVRFLLLLCFSFPIHVFSCVNVVTKLGDIEGFGYLLENGKTICAFLGVPFAMPPVGDYRFEEPRPVEKWYGTWMAKTSSPACLQLHRSGVLKGSEDCLYLDIYSPTSSTTSALPVMVYIHGGAFRMGKGGMYSAKHIMNETNFIFVSINYRLGPLGFLSTEDSHVPGNNGLKDQAMALRWIQDNIESFGGDKNQVTIVGHSAGGASVQLHYLSPWSKGLFRNGISASGTALNHWALTENPLKKAITLAEAVGCPTTSSFLLVRCLKQRPGNHFFHNFSSTPWRSNSFIPFKPVIERAGNNPFLNEHPYNLLSKGKVQDKPWLVSVTSDEGLNVLPYITENEALFDLQRNWHKIAPIILEYNSSAPSGESAAVSQKVKEFYFGIGEVVLNDTGKIIKMLSDRHFKSGIGEAAAMQGSVMSAPVYMYSVGYMFNASFTDRLFSKGYYGVSHGDEIFEIFSSVSSKHDQNVAIVSMLRDIWFSFMNNGIPTTGKGTTWSPITRSYNKSIVYLNIISPNDMALVEDTDFGNKQFWNSLLLNENRHYKNSIPYIISSDGNILNLKCSAVCFIFFTFILI